MTEPRRPDPDALLALVQSDEGAAERTRGRLKVFLGATAGVGKTYAMLQAAQERARAGVDVVIGIVETHRRRDTEAQLAGLEVLPRVRLPHAGVMLEEFDVDAALARRPGLLLVDELAHTNAPGARHAKRWQDVEELLGAGIDVFTTLNVQHLESLNDVVARVTGVTVRETVPDVVLERADEVELIDLPPEELLARLRDGKVYVPEQAERAMERFFRKGNLIALRQLALLRTADRVERQMELYRRAQAAEASWPVRDRLLVGVGPAPSSERLIRATKRMADRLGAEWVAAFVETPAAARWPAPDRDRVWASLRLADQLGGRTVTLAGDDAAREMLAFARAHNVTKLVVGKPTHATWRDLLGRSFHDRIVRGSGAVDVYVITGDEGDTARAPRAPAPRVHETEARRPDGYLVALGAVVASTAVAALLAPAFELTNLAMLYLVAVVLVAMRGGRGPAALVAVLSVAAFDFAFVPPRFTFAVSDGQYVVTFVVMLAVGLVIGSLTARLRDGREAARAREWRTAFLYEVGRELATAAAVDGMLALVLPRIATLLEAEVDALLPDAAGLLQAWDAEDGDPLDDPAARGIAGWVNANRQAAGAGTSTFADRPDLFMPLVAGERALGVLWVRPVDSVRLRAPEQRQLLGAVAGQLAGAMARVQLAEDERRSRQQAELARLRSHFVASASRELRAPLAALDGRLASLPGADAARASLAQLQSLVDDLLDLARLESGRMALSLHPTAPGALAAGAAAEQQERARALGVALDVDVEATVPAVLADPVRMRDVLGSLVARALRAPGPRRRVSISADLMGDVVQFEVADDGPPLSLEAQARAFEPFAGDVAEEADGAGVRLALARDLVRAHGGTIWVDSGPASGVVIAFTLPVAREGAGPTDG